jgi:predicted dehydrogenase
LRRPSDQVGKELQPRVSCLSTVDHSSQQRSKRPHRELTADTPMSNNMINSAFIKSSNIIKLIRFAEIYGIARTLYKASGRLRASFAFPRPGIKGAGQIGVIGCGQFAFATIGYFIASAGKSFSICYDVNREAANSFARFHGVPRIADSVQEVLSDQAAEIVYIASHHSTHADYAIDALQKGLDVYCEKPIAVTFDQLERLSSAVHLSKGRIYAGYNRPFSKAVRAIREATGALDKPISLSCFIAGHKIAPSHWYREPKEGTRICGNVGHWLDLAVHMLSWGNLPDQWRIQLHWSDEDARDDDLAITLTSSRGDLVSIVLTSRSEPFEGINETINFQQGDVIAKIDDFRSLTIWRGSYRRRYRFWPKDVGHGAAILQPFKELGRDWREVERSSLLMLEIARMVQSGQRAADVSFTEVSGRYLASSQVGVSEDDGPIDVL